MYSRIFKTFLVVSRQLPGKYENIKSQTGVSSLLLQNFEKSFEKNCSVRHCTTTGETDDYEVSEHKLFRGPDKDAIAQKKLDEWRLIPGNEKQWKILQLEVDVHRQNGNPVPEDFKPRHWLELTLCESRNKRRKYLEFLFGLEKKKQNELERRRLSRDEREKFLDREEERDPATRWLDYRLGRNSPFLRFYDTTMNQLGNWRLLRAMMYGQKIVMDCGYEHEMTRQERRNCARQMMLSWAVNRDHKDPFDLHYCNFNSEGDVHADFHSFIPTMYDDAFPINLTPKSYLDIFDKKQLVYLTPDCNNELKEYDPDAVYIIGALIDKVSGRPLSMSKAKREGLKTAKLPIDRYLHFGGGATKSLTLNQMMAIMLDINLTNDWTYALRHVPQRKLFHNRQEKMEKRMSKFMRNNAEQASVFRGTSPQDFSAKARKKFQI